LSESHAFNEVCFRINLLMNADPEVVLDRTLVFKHEFGLQAFDKGINDGIGSGKNAAIIHVKNNDTVIANEQAGVTGGLVKTPSNQTANKMLVPIMCGLFATIQIFFLSLIK